MDSFTFNKIAGAVLGCCLIVFVIIEVSHQFYPNPRAAHGHVENPGYVVEGMEHGTGHGDVAEVEEVVDLGALMADASAETGAGRFRVCSSCHSVEAGGRGTGPTLWGIVGRAAGSVEGYNYSRAMAAMGGDWTYERLFEFLENPRASVPGTNMSYAGMRRDSQRAEVLAYLRTLSDSPLPLPAPNAQEAMHDVAPAPAAHSAAAPDTAIVEDAHSEAMEEAVKAVEVADDAAAEAMEGKVDERPAPEAAAEEHEAPEGDH